MRKLIRVGTVHHDVLGAGPSPSTPASVSDDAVLITNDGRRRTVRIVAYGASRALLGASDAPVAA
jgi:hypothetical protein